MSNIYLVLYMYSICLLRLSFLFKGKGQSHDYYNVWNHYFCMCADGFLSVFETLAVIFEQKITNI